MQTAGTTKTTKGERPISTEADLRRLLEFVDEQDIDLDKILGTVAAARQQEQQKELDEARKAGIHDMTDKAKWVGVIMAFLIQFAVVVKQVSDTNSIAVSAKEAATRLESETRTRNDVLASQVQIALSKTAVNESQIGGINQQMQDMNGKMDRLLFMLSTLPGTKKQ